MYVTMADPSTLYLSVGIVRTIDRSYDLHRIYIAALNAAASKPVCVNTMNGALQYSSEMYAKDVKSFLSVFTHMLKALDSSDASFQEEYDKLEMQEGNLTN